MNERFVFRLSLVLPLTILWVGLLETPNQLTAHGFVESSLGIHPKRHTQHAVRVQCNFYQNRNMENTEGEEEGTQKGIESDDVVQMPPMAPKQEISIPKELPNHILISDQEKDYRERERVLLAQVQEGDKAIKELRTLWGSQSGNTWEEELMYKAARGIGDPRSWDESRQILEKLTTENPTFLEPFARLSKLYCLMGRIEDSQSMALEVLRLKPWHILAIETMVATSYALNQIESSVYWATQRMPPPSETTKRKEWIRRAIEKSLEFEIRLLEQQKIGGKKRSSVFIEEDAWQ